MKICEDCGDECKRRMRCWHCGLFVCPWCWGHVHRCEPGHKRDECRHLKIYKKYGDNGYLERVREMSLIAIVQKEETAHVGSKVA